MLIEDNINENKNLEKINIIPKDFSEMAIEFSNYQRTDPIDDVIYLQHIFHRIVINSFSLVEPKIFEYYLYFISINPQFEPLTITINELIHRLRFNKLNSDINYYEFFLQIEPSINNIKLKNALNLLRKIYISKSKEHDRDTKFKSWVKDLITD